MTFARFPVSATWLRWLPAALCLAAGAGRLRADGPAGAPPAAPSADPVAAALAALPPYRPQVAVTGTIRVWTRPPRFFASLIKAWQDGLQMKQGSQQYLYQCQIQGSVDYIYDGGTAFLDHCTIVQRRISPTGPTDCAPATPAGVRGIIFWQCTITAVSGVTANSSYLGRVWKAPGEMAYINCTIGSHIKPAGYLSWNEGTTSRVAEYPCPSTRASWCKRLTSSAGYTKSDILGSWNPRL